MWWTMKHKYTDGYPYGRCVHCGRQTGLDPNQLKSVPRSMATCAKSDKKAGFFEVLTGCYDVA